MNCAEIFAKRLVFLSGKGGVGKSALAATLGWISAQQGRRTLLVELDTIETIPRIFGRPESGKYQEVDLAPNISSLHLDGKSGLEEYLQMVMKSKKFVQMIFRSPLYQYFVNIAPGLKELMAVGKLWHLEQRLNPAGHGPAYDLIIVDTPATGHTISYLQMPMTAAGTVKRGLVKREAQKVVDLLRDPTRTSFNIVTTLGEMPVNETMELYTTISTKLEMPVGCIFVNQVVPPFFADSDLEAFVGWKTTVLQESGGPEDRATHGRRIQEHSILACAESWKMRRKSQELQWERLRQEIPRPLVSLPFVYDAESPFRIIEVLSGILADKIEDPAPAPSTRISGEKRDAPGP